MMFEPSETVTQAFFDHLVTSHSLGHHGFHGKDHWLRVLKNGREVASATGANLRVVELFAVIHDSKRENEDYDPDHGRRAAEYARTLQGVWFSLETAELELLCHACLDATVGQFWGTGGLRKNMQILFRIMRLFA